MNEGKICVSVCAETVDEFIKKAKQAVEIADVVELRFDCLSKNEFCYDDEKETEGLHHRILAAVFDEEVIQTFRPQAHGGARGISESERDQFWHRVLDNSGADTEEDRVDDLMNRRYSPLICSYHDFETSPANLSEIYARLVKTNTDIVKIAVRANDTVDSLEVWKLLEIAEVQKNQISSEKPKKIKWGWGLRFWNFLARNRFDLDKYETKHFQDCVPIAMGEAGKWTRILGLAYGAPITYASLEEGDETAPGQISAKDLIEVYRVKELNPDTEIYGVIGNPVSHSLSPYLHNAAFKHHKLNAVYIPFEVSDLDEFIKRMVREDTREIDWNLKGFSVTIPHKEAIIKHLDFIDDDATKIGAVNTVKIVGGKLHGYNTDAYGFIETLQNSYSDLKDAKAGIIGCGGAARACIYALNQEGTDVTIFARNRKKAQLLADAFDAKLKDISALDSGNETLDCLINATPLGTIGELENQTPIGQVQLKNLHLAYDLVYNPIETLFLRNAKEIGVPTIGGLEMLVAQGRKQFEIWTGLAAPENVMNNAALQRLK